jgi:hypothetical protein
VPFAASSCSSLGMRAIGWRREVVLAGPCLHTSAIFELPVSPFGCFSRLDAQHNSTLHC